MFRLGLLLEIEALCAEHGYQLTQLTEISEHEIRKQ